MDALQPSAIRLVFSGGIEMPGPVTVKMLADQLEGHVRDCAEQGRQTTRALLEFEKTQAAFSAKLDDLNKSAWRVVGAVAALLATAIVGVAAQNYILHEATKAQLTATSGAVAPAGDQMRDIQYRAIMERLDKAGFPPVAAHR